MGGDMEGGIHDNEVHPFSLKDQSITEGVSLLSHRSSPESESMDVEGEISEKEKAKINEAKMTAQSVAMLTFDDGDKTPPKYDPTSSLPSLST